MRFVTIVLFSVCFRVRSGRAVSGGSGEGDSGQGGQVERRVEPRGGPVPVRGSPARPPSPVLEAQPQLPDPGPGQDVGDPLDDKGGRLLLGRRRGAWGGQSGVRAPSEGWGGVVFLLCFSGLSFRWLGNQRMQKEP